MTPHVAAQSESYPLSPSISSLPAGSYGAAITATVSNSPQSLTFAVCFYTGYGSTTPIVPSSFTYAGGSSSIALSVPASSIQDVPPSAFTSGHFAASLYTVPASATACSGPAQASGTASTITLNYPTLTSISLASTPQYNPKLTSVVPSNLTLTGTNFLSQSGTTGTVPSAVIFNTSVPVPGTVRYISPTSLVSTIPITIPAGTGSANLQVCNTAVYSYCSGTRRLVLVPLPMDSGSVNISPTTASPLQLVTVSATFGSSTPSLAGAPGGMVDFHYASTELGSSQLTLDTTGSFVVAPVTSLQTATPLVAPIFADFNQDGLADLLMVQSGSSTLHLLFGTTPSGSFATDVPISVQTEGPAVTILSAAVADLNHDGFPDIALLCQVAGTSGSYSTIYTLLNDGSGSFLAPVNGFATVYGSRIVAGDFNKDGKQDLVVAGALDADGTVGLQVLLGDGTGKFTAGPATAGLNTAPSASFGGYQIAVGDFDNDGFPDIAVLNGANAAGGQLSNSINVFQNDGKGDFTRTVNVPTDGTNTTSFQIAPLGPGQLPTLILSSTTSSAPGLYVALNQSTANIAFTAALQFTAVPTLKQAVIGDFNGDGLVDAAIDDGSTVHVLSGNSQGLFTLQYPNLSIPSVAGTTLLAAPDVNVDSYADLVLLSNNGTVNSDYTSYSVGAVITSGTASTSLSPAYFPAGVHDIQARTPGTFTIECSSVLNSVTIIPTTPIVSLNSSVASPVNYGTSGIMLIATIPDPTATGTMTFYNNGKPLGTAKIIDGTSAVATLTPSTLAAGTYSFTVTYNGDANHNSSTSAALPFQVNPIPATITWKPNPATIVYGTALSASQLDAAASGIANAAVAGSFSYSPALGAVLPVGQDSVTATFTPTDTNYTGSSASQIITVTQATPVITWLPNPSTIVYGTGLSAAQFDATANTPGTFTYAPAVGTVLTAGTQTLSLTFTPTDTTDFKSAAATTNITVTQAQPVLTWPTPAMAVLGSSLSSAQLDATATGVTGAALPGTFVYTPPAGTVISSATEKLSVVFTPSDTIDYTSASASVTLNATSVTLTGLSSSSAQLGAAAQTITLTGTGFVSTAVAQMNGTAIPTTFVNSTTLTAIIPASDFLTVQVLQISVTETNPTQTTNALPFSVIAPTAAVVFSGPPNIAPGTQTTLDFQLTAPYPVDLTATFTITFAPASGLPDDPNVQFSTGGRTLAVVIPAGSTTLSPIMIQSGTVAGTITVTISLEAGGANVTPSSIQPLTIQALLSFPGITSVSYSTSGSTLTVVVRAFSNTREVISAKFHFTPVSGGSIATQDVTVQVGSLYAAWYTSSESAQYGSECAYTQTFNLSSDASVVGQVGVVLTNTQGSSPEATTP
jgi:hypothetical protein